ncbi:MAG: acyltransferase [Deltaproteobacteria bacterium]|nr:acyltransferase [Deltaproteobacteria bacterium]MBW2365880.1 acyltransferase [Deltaproteobacteria bacterium]
MLNFLPGPIKGVICIILLMLNLLFWVTLLLPFAIIKIILPIRSIRKKIDVVLNFMCTRWASWNKIFFMLLNNLNWDVKGDDNLSMKNWYLVLSNHQSWTDILILLFVLNNRIPYFRFFLKRELAWLPIFNFVWYALDYPYMKRYSKKFLEKRPDLKGKDIETTRKSCERFEDVPVSIMNFVEGTRFTPVKHQQQQSPFKHLLKPKAGGVAFVLSAMGDQLSYILDVTISYSPEAKGIWDFLCGRISDVAVRINHLNITDEVMGNYVDDESFRQNFQKWVNALWKEKDDTLDKLKTIN